MKRSVARCETSRKFLPPRFLPPAVAAAEFALRSAPRRRRLHLSQMLGLLPAATPGAALHVVFSAECTPLFDWHSVGLFYSFYASGQHCVQYLALPTVRRYTQTAKLASSR